MGNCCARGPTRESKSSLAKESIKPAKPDLPVFKDLPQLTEEAVLSEYSLGKVLGKGSFATVHEPTETSTNKKYAMKVVTIQSLVEQHERIPNLRKEVEICLPLSHPVSSAFSFSETNKFHAGCCCHGTEHLISGKSDANR